MGVVCLVEVCGHWFVQLLCCDVGSVAIQPDMQGILCLSHILHFTLVTADNVHDVFFWFTCKLVCDGVSPACGIIADKSVGAFYELAGFASSAYRGGWGWCFYLCSNKEIL